MASAGILALAIGVSGACYSDGAGSSADTSQLPDGPSTDTSTSGTAVCERWNADRADRTEGAWTGSSQRCEAGELQAPGPDNTLRQVNLYRWLAGLPAVELNARKSADAQACAVIMDANDDIEHRVPASWDCRSAAGLDAALRSNLATLPAVAAVDLYMIDGGVPNLGHRRWILANTLGPIGVGSTAEFSCLHVIGGEGTTAQRWTAWPPPGDFPIEAAKPFRWDSLDAAGWSIQSDLLDLRGAAVTVTNSAGDALPVSVDSHLDAGYGSTFAIGFRPQGWAMEAGETYKVAVRGIIEDLDYEVRVVVCGS